MYNSFLTHLALGLEVTALVFCDFSLIFPQPLPEDVMRSCWKGWPKKQQSRSWRLVRPCQLHCANVM